MKHLPLLLLCCLLGQSLITAATLTDTQGRSIEVEILNVTEESVSVRRADGISFDIPLSKLSTDSQALVREQQNSRSPSAESNDDLAQLNELLGLELWTDTNLWDDAPQEVAYRLNWPQESKTKSQSSFRVYFKNVAPSQERSPTRRCSMGKMARWTTSASCSPTKAIP